VAREPLTADQLEALAGIDLQALYDGLYDLVSLLVEDWANGARYYRLYHGAFQDFLTGRQHSREFWIDPVSFHLQIANYYQKRHGRYWQDCDSYGLRNTVTHFERAAQGSLQPERHHLVEQLVGVVLDPGFQHTREDKLHDLFGLGDDLALATSASVDDEHLQAPLVLAAAALGWAAFRSRKLNPRKLFELAGQGQVSAALAYLNQYRIEPEWDLSARWIIAWLCVDVEPPLARELVDGLMQDAPAEGPFRELALRVRAALEDISPLLAAPPPAPGADVVRALVGENDLQDETMILSSLGTSEIRLPDEERTFYLADRDGPLLVAYAATHPTEGTEYLRKYINLHMTYQYSFYRRESLKRLLDSTLRHPDPAWARAMAVEVVSAAVTEEDVEFREGLILTILTLHARGGQPGAAERLEEHLQVALSEGQSVRGSKSDGDPWAYRLRRLAALAEGYALALDKPAAAVALLERAQALSRGYAGFTAPALIELTNAMLVCGMQDAIIRQLFEEARIASHSIIDPTFCARATARWNALTKDWSNSGQDLASTIGAFADMPGASEFAAAYYVGESFAARSVETAQMPLPDWLYQANTLRSLAAAFQLPLSSVRRLNPNWEPDAPLPQGTRVSMPDPRMTSQLATQLAALVLADPDLPGSEKTRLIQKLVPAAVGNATALDTVLSRLLLAAKPDDLNGLERLLAR
jgi:hypothetical protein